MNFGHRVEGDLMGLIYAENIPDTEAEAVANEMARLLPPPPSRTGAAGDDPIAGRAPTWAGRVDWGVIVWAVALYATFLLGGLLS